MDEQPARFVYFMQDRREGLIKIGFSRNPQKRLRALRQTTGRDLVLTRVIAGDFEEERQLHSIFSPYRVQGEWFRPVSPLATVADAHALADDDAIPYTHHFEPIPECRPFQNLGSSHRYVPDSLTGSQARPVAAAEIPEPIWEDTTPLW